MCNLELGHFEQKLACLCYNFPRAFTTLRQRNIEELVMFKKISRIFTGDPHARKIKDLTLIVDQVNALAAKTVEYRARLAKGATLDELLPEAFATVREASKRVLGQRHYDVQLICGINLHQGAISELRTGEGKTLSATLPLYLNALESKGAHLITVNDYLFRFRSASLPLRPRGTLFKGRNQSAASCPPKVCLPG
jgi:hypothetical protein